MTAGVVIYTAPGRPGCEELKHCLDLHHVPYEDRDVTRDKAAAAELEELRLGDLPVTRVGKSVVVGFDREELEAVLRSNGATAGAGVNSATDDRLTQAAKEERAPAGTPIGDVVLEASEDSFPASDPPAWTAR